MGDSRIYQWNIPDTIIPAANYANLGVNAQTTAQVLYRLGLHLQQGTPEFLFLQAGINDIKAIGVFPEKKDFIIAECIKNIELLIDTCIKCNIHPVFCTIIPPGDVQLFRRPVWTSEIKDKVAYVNKIVSDFCKSKNVSIFDTYSTLSDGKGVLLKQYQADDLHLNRAGYDMLNRELKSFLIREKIVIK
ncbi:GDSL-type esterase/lipase family protein [Ferruginibacter sp.]|uniref:SGNH/GDSL hydrolase family protein n=1 Tax=Ferruginibacter sp. TaxID=1940288 RepID=UPI00265A6759|nr:GDSL-type esterase/lipase family protein [Ferruginibacter sp.]